MAFEHRGFRIAIMSLRLDLAAMPRMVLDTPRTGAAERRRATRAYNRMMARKKHGIHVPHDLDEAAEAEEALRSACIRAAMADEGTGRCRTRRTRGGDTWT